MSLPIMVPCTRCEGRGERLVEMTDGTKASKKCWICDGEGRVPMFQKPEVIKEKPIQEDVVGNSFQAPKKSQKPSSHLSAPLGDLSWLPSRRNQS